MSSEPWFKPASLKVQYRNMAAQTVAEANPNSDFGSYKIVNKTNVLSKESNIEAHGFIDQKGLNRFYITLLEFMRQKGLSFGAITDIGCGLGLVTKACQTASKLPSYGIEISTDATDFANRNHAPCRFISGAVDPDDPQCPLTILVKDLQQCLVVASEIYPFTRTDDHSVHSAFLQHIFKSPNVKTLVLVNGTRYLREISNYPTFLSSISNWSNWGYKVENVIFPTPKICGLLPTFALSPLLKILNRLFIFSKGTILVTIVQRK